MATLAETVTDVTDDRLAARNALVLAAAQALAGGNNTVIVATGGLSAPCWRPILRWRRCRSASWRWACGSVRCRSVSWLGLRTPLRAADRYEGALSALSPAPCCRAFALSWSARFAGLCAAAHQSYRFAAADNKSAHCSASACAAGGVFAGVNGPQLVILTSDAWRAYLFAGTYLAQSACAVIAGAVGDAALGLQWHVIGMYAPSFFTGTLIMRFGVRTVMATGLLLIAGAASIGLLGLALWNFWLALALLGVGWNLSFIGATTLITECHGPRERNKVQAFNDFLVFGSMAFGSFLSGLLLTRYGWGAVNQVVFPVLITAGLLLAWGSLVRRPDPV
jgi:hypothetical protein